MDLFQEVYNYYSSPRSHVGFGGEKHIREVAVQSTIRNKIPTQVIDFAMSLGYLTTTSKLLDLGCGLGGTLVAAKERGIKKVYGIDTDPDAVLITRKRIQSDTVVCGDAQEANIFGDAVFDFVVSLQTLEHVKSPEKYLSTAKRLLRPGGTLMIVAPNYLFPWEGHYKVPYVPYLLPYTKPVFKVLMGLFGSNASVADEINFFITPGSVRSMLSKAGFQEVAERSTERFMQKVKDPSLIDNERVKRVAFVVSKVVRSLGLFGLAEVLIKITRLYHPLVFFARRP